MTNRPTPTISIQNVSLSYGASSNNLPALSDVSLDVHQGERLALVGPSGCGKSTLLRLIASLIRPTAGSIEAPSVLSRRLKIGYLPQHTGLLPFKNVWENINLPLAFIPHRQSREYVEWLIEIAGLSDYTQMWPSQLSGGQQQRVAIVRALVHHPDLLLLDEPFSSLDEISRESLQEHLRHILVKTGVTTIVVTHDLAEAVFICDKVGVMTPRPGKIGRIISVDLPQNRSAELRSTVRYQKNVAELRKSTRLLWR